MGRSLPAIRPARPGDAAFLARNDPAFEAMTGSPGFRRFTRAI
jgi:hypothetical protein